LSGGLIRIGSWNVRSCCSYKQRSDIDSYLETCPVDYIALQECRINGRGIKLLKEFVLHYYGVDNGRAGVGLLIRNGYNHDLKNVITINESNGRICVYVFSKKSIIVAYAPTECKYSLEEKEKFYDLLDNSIQLCNKKFPIYVCGDFNARIGPSFGKTVGKFINSSEKYANENGTLLLDFAVKHHLRFTNSFFNCKQAKKRSWKCNAGKSNTFYASLDHILSANRFKTELRKCSTFGKFQPSISDHRVIIAWFASSRVKFKGKPRPFIPPQYFDVEKVQEVSRFVKDKCNTDEIFKGNVNTAWNNLEFLLSSSIKEVQIASKNDSNDINKLFLNGENSRMYSLDEFWDEKATLIEKEMKKHNLRNVFNLIKKCNFSKSSKTPIPSAVLAEKICLKPEKYQEFLLFTCVNQNDDMNKVPSESEVFAICKSMKNGKSPGLDNIPAEVYKDGFLSSLLHKFIVKIWDNGVIPDKWRVAKLVPIPKPGGDYRGISLLSTGYKIYAKILTIKSNFRPSNDICW
jgi:exonuclease III